MQSLNMINAYPKCRSTTGRHARKGEQIRERERFGTATAIDTAVFRLKLWLKNKEDTEKERERDPNTTCPISLLIIPTTLFFKNVKNLVILLGDFYETLKIFTTLSWHDMLQVL